MAKMPALDQDFYPPFTGFPEEGIRFLRLLKKNNRRQWFEKHKEEYDLFVKLPLQSLIVGLQGVFGRFAPEFEVHPRRSMFRIYRDVRFSKDKSPYKTHAAAHFVLRGKPKGTEGLGYYVHIEPEEVFLGAGIYMPQSEQLKKIRWTLAHEGNEFLRIMRDKALQKTFGKLQGERLQRVPREFPPGHPLAEWLRLKQFFVGVSWQEERIYKSRFLHDVEKAFQVATPFVRFLNKAIS